MTFLELNMVVTLLTVSIYYLMLNEGNLQKLIRSTLILGPRRTLIVPFKYPTLSDLKDAKNIPTNF